LHAVQHRVDRTGADIHTRAAKLLDDPEAEDLAFRGIVKDVQPDQSAQRSWFLIKPPPASKLLGLSAANYRIAGMIPGRAAARENWLTLTDKLPRVTVSKLDNDPEQSIKGVRHGR
jgi:hypothetical protein